MVMLQHSVDEVALLEEEKNRTTISWLEEQEKNKQHMHTIATLQHKVNDLEREIEMMVKVRMVMVMVTTRDPTELRHHVRQT